MSRDVDVLIIGAGISGIGLGCRLTRQRPGTTYTILERRDTIGGTWDLFRYPGIRSDSDMYTFAYPFRPWRGTKVLADGALIREYVAETADEYDVRSHIDFGRSVVRADFSTSTGRWTVEARNEHSGRTDTYSGRFLVGCTGYYNFEAGHRPVFPGEETFPGPIVHPQHWPADLDYSGRRVVIIGSGATAITLVPAMAAQAEHVTMLQRSPTWVLALPSRDKISAALRRAHVPLSLVYRLGRFRNIGIQRAFYALTRVRPALARKLLLQATRRQVGPGIDMKHFTPTYDPWDQRLCVVPDGDLFRALRRGRATVVTDRIERITPTGITLASGTEVAADIIVTATGLELQMLGGITVTVDGTKVDPHEHVIYKGVLLDGVPNSMIVIGYTNASWTLKADLAAEYFCRLLGHLDARGYRQFVAIATPEDIGTESLMGSALSSGYVRRADGIMPRQGTRRPWRNFNDYLRDAPVLRYASIDDDALKFSR